MRISRDEQTCLPFESPKPMTDFADTPISFILKPWLPEPFCPLHLPGPFFALNPSHILPSSLTPALAPPISNKQSAIGFPLPNGIIGLCNKDTLRNFRGLERGPDSLPKLQTADFISLERRMIPKQKVAEALSSRQEALVLRLAAMLGLRPLSLETCSESEVLQSHQERM